MKTYLVPPAESLVAEIVRHLRAEGRDYSGHLVVFPGKRPSHFLRKALGEKEQRSFIPPRIFSMDEFIDFLYEEVLGLRSKKMEVIDAVAILYDIHKNSPAPLGGASFLTPDSFFPVGLKIFNDLEELSIEAVPPRTVREIDAMAEEKIPEPTARRLQSLSYFYQAFYETLDKRRCSTRSSRYRAVSDEIERVNFDSFRSLIFAGFFGLTRSEKTIFASLMKRDNTLFLFQEGPGIEEALSDLGVTCQSRSTPLEPEIHFYKSPDAHGQAFIVGNLLREEIDRDGRPGEDTVIVLPSPETLFPLLHQALGLFGPEDYNVSLGYPLQRTPLFGFFNSLMELRLSMDGDRLYLPYYLEFVLHPYTKNIYFRGRSDLTRILFHALEEALTEKRAKKFMSLSEIEEDEGIAEFIRERVLSAEPDVGLSAIREHLKEIHSKTIGGLLSVSNVGEFANRLREVIEYIYENSTARLHPFFYPYAESFVKHLDFISRSLMKDIQFEEIGSYFSLIKKSIMTSYVPFVGTPLRGLQVLGFLETRNIRFSKVFFLDVNEGVVPDTVREDSVLPFRVRKILGLATYLEREKLMAYYFETLIRGAREVHLFYVENDEKERSRLVERLLWERQKRERKSADKGYVQPIQYAVTLRASAPRAIEKSEGAIRFLKGFRFSATSLDLYLNCPLQFYYQYVLGLKEREIVQDEIEREEIGSFVHLVLYDYFKGRIGRVLTKKEVDGRELERLIRGHFEQRYGRDPAGEIYLLRRQIERHLKEFIEAYQVPKLKEHSIRIIGLEERLEVEKESFRLVSRLDRIERRGDRITILDYKISANPSYLNIRFSKLDPGKRDAWNEAIGTLQLPFYLMSYSEATRQKPEEVDCLFLLLGKTRLGPEIELPLFQDEEEFKEKYEVLCQVIFTLLREILDPGLPFMPPRSLKKACRGCPYPFICTN